MIELFVLTMRAALTARIVLVAYCHEQATTLVPVMRKLRHTATALAALFIASLGVSLQAVAYNLPGPQPQGSGEGAPSGAMAEVRDGISLDEAVSRAERQYRARVVRTDVQDEDGRKVYVLKMLSEDGRVFTVRIDAATGRMR
jgi:hypothetical protein